MSYLNYFVVCSPLQLINATEAKEKFKLPNDECLLIILNLYGPANYNQIKNVLIDYTWSNIEIISLSNKDSKLLFPIKFRKEIRAYKGTEVAKLFIGEFFAFEIRALANVLSYKELILFDDGNAILKTIGHLLDKRPESFNLHQLLRKIYYRLSGLKIIEYKTVTIFTAYADLFHSAKELSIIKNEYTISKRLNSKKEATNEIFFLGTQLVERGLIQFSNYQKHLERAISLLEQKNNTKVIYIPHRKELNEKLDLLRNNIGLTIRKIPVSIELYLLKSDCKPAMISTFFSSAIFSLDFIFGDEISKNCFLLGLANGRISKSYEEYRNLGIEVIEDY